MWRGVSRQSSGILDASALRMANWQYRESPMIRGVSGRRTAERRGEILRWYVNDQRASAVYLTCPQCGQVYRMSATTYADCSYGVLCGVCDPQRIRMIPIPTGSMS